MIDLASDRPYPRYPQRRRPSRPNAQPLWLWLLSLLLLVPLRPSPSQAQEHAQEAAPSTSNQGARARARELGKQGLSALDEKRYTEAEQHLSEAIALYPAPTLFVLRSKARAAQGKLVAATQDLRTVQNMPPVAGEPAAYTQARTQAKSDLPTLEARVGHLVVTINDPSSAVHVNGTLWPNQVFGQPVPVDPGLYRAEAHNSQGPVHTETQVGEGQTVTLHVELPRPAAEPPPALAAGQQPPPAAAATGMGMGAPTGRSQTTLPGAPPGPTPEDGGPGAAAYLVGTLTLATAVATGVTGVLYLDKQSAYNSKNKEATTPAEHEEAKELRSEASTMGWLSTGLGIATLAGVVVSAVLFLDSGDGGTPQAAGDLKGTVGLGHASLTVAF